MSRFCCRRVSRPRPVLSGSIRPHHALSVQARLAITMYAQLLIRSFSRQAHRMHAVLELLDQVLLVAASIGLQAPVPPRASAGRW